MSSRYVNATGDAAKGTRFKAYFDGLQRFGIRPGLERIRALLKLAADPQSRYPLILVGGTNGKGSTCEFLARSLAAEGRRTGLFTSPHLYRWNERIRLLEQASSAEVAASSHTDATTESKPFEDAISNADFDALLEDALPLLRTVAHDYGRPTEFETLTFMGLWHFARAAADIAVVEVGLGGRWDCTNASEPTVSVITHVALDHCDRLGETVEEIARDKVQIARPGRILITAEIKGSVLDVFREHCDAIGARLWAPLALAWTTPGEEPALLHALEIIEAHSAGTLPPIKDASDFQAINLKTAAVARFALAQEVDIPPRILPSARPVPGRAEVLRSNPTVIIDGSNNPDGAAHLAGHLRNEYPGRKFIFVTGISADKDYSSMIAQWAPLASRFITTQADNPRAAGAALLATEAGRFIPNVEAIASVPAAVERALEIATPGDIICICGSFFVLAEADREKIRGY